jgi:hypothetical protein
MSEKIFNRHILVVLNDFSSFSADTLKIGDVIHIKNLKTDCMLFAEGILMEDVAVNDALSSFEDALFCIHLQRQYLAALELEKCVQLHPDAASSSEDVAISKYHHALQVHIHLRACEWALTPHR